MQSQFGQLFSFLAKHPGGPEPNPVDDSWLSDVLQDLNDQNRSLKQEQGEIWDWLAKAEQQRRDQEARLSKAVIDTHQTAAEMVLLRELVEPPEQTFLTEKVAELCHNQEVLSEKTFGLQEAHAAELRQMKAGLTAVYANLQGILARNNPAAFDSLCQTVQGLSEGQGQMRGHLRTLIQQTLQLQAKLGNQSTRLRELGSNLERLEGRCEGIKVEQDLLAFRVEKTDEQLSALQQLQASDVRQLKADVEEQRSSFEKRQDDLQAQLQQLAQAGPPREVTELIQQQAESERMLSELGDQAFETRSKLETLQQELAALKAPADFAAELAQLQDQLASINQRQAWQEREVAELHEQREEERDRLIRLEAAVESLRKGQDAVLRDAKIRNERIQGLQATVGELLYSQDAPKRPRLNLLAR